MPDTATQDTATATTEATSEVVRKGFVYGLAFAAVRKGEGKDRKVVGAEFRTTTTKGEDIVWKNVEAPYPITEAAAKQAADDCTTTIYTLDENGDVHERKVNGIVAAVNIALAQRRDEGGRGKVRGRHIKGEDQFRSLMLGTYGFTFDKVETTVSRDELAAILASEDATPEEKMAAMEAMLQSQGVNIR